MSTYSTQPNTVIPRGCLAFVQLNASDSSQCIGEDVADEANAPWLTHHVRVIQESTQLFACQELRGHFLQSSLNPNGEKQGHQGIALLPTWVTVRHSPSLNHW